MMYRRRLSWTGLIALALFAACLIGSVASAVDNFSIIVCDLRHPYEYAAVRVFDGLTGGWLANWDMGGDKEYYLYGVTIGNDGYGYVCHGEHTAGVARFNLATGVKENISVSGLSRPQGIAFGPDGNLYIANRPAVHGVEKLDPVTGQFVRFADVPDHPFDLQWAKVNGENHLFVLSCIGAKVYEFKATGEFVRTYDTPAEGFGLTVGGGYIYTHSRTVTGDICKIDMATGAAVWSLSTGYTEGRGIKLGPDGLLYLAFGWGTNAGPFTSNYGCVKQFDPETGTEIVTLLPSVNEGGSLYNPTRLDIAIPEPPISFWFADASDPTGTPITNIDAGSGQPFDVSVWYKTDASFAQSTWETMLGFDRSDSMGPSATAIDGKLALNGAAASAVSNVNSNFPVKLNQSLAGGRADSGSRPYGLRVSYAIQAGAPQITQNAPTKLYDVRLMNNMPAGGSYDVALWDSPAGGASNTSFLMNTNLEQFRASAALTVNSITATATERIIEEWKKLGNGTNGKLVAAEVTIDVGDSFFVEESGRYTGIRVAKLGSETYTRGMRATITGSIQTNVNGERYVVPTNITTAPGSVTIQPLGLTNKTLGGSDWNYSAGAGQLGGTGGSGLNNVGLLVKAWGKPVLTGSSSSFKLDDGSGVDVTVQLPAGQTHGWTAGTVPGYVMVTGASGLKKTGSVYSSTVYIGNFGTDVVLAVP